MKDRVETSQKQLITINKARFIMHGDIDKELKRMWKELLILMELRYEHIILRDYQMVKLCSKKQKKQKNKL